MKDLNAILPLFCFDIDLLVNGEIPRFKLLKKFNKLEANLDAELAAVRLKQQATIILLSQYEEWQTNLMEPLISEHAYNFILPCHTEEQFDFIRDRYLPYAMFTSIPKLWGKEYSDVYPFERGVNGWITVFNTIRDEMMY